MLQLSTEFYEDPEQVLGHRWMNRVTEHQDFFTRSYQLLFSNNTGDYSSWYLTWCAQFATQIFSDQIKGITHPRIYVFFCPETCDHLTCVDDPSIKFGLWMNPHLRLMGAAFPSFIPTYYFSFAWRPHRFPCYLQPGNTCWSLVEHVDCCGNMWIYPHFELWGICACVAPRGTKV